MKMPIERKDRSFDKIFDEVTLDKIPMEYVQEVRVNLLDGSVIIIDKPQLQNLSSEDDIINNLKRNDIIDVQLSLDYESIKSDVSKNVQNVLSNYFKNE